MTAFPCTTPAVVPPARGQRAPGTPPTLLTLPAAALRTAACAPAPQPARFVRRRITPVAGHALETLGHAIEYLADEWALSARELAVMDARDPRVEALQILMSVNRSVYRDCPEVEPLGQRLARLLWGAAPSAASAGTTAAPAGAPAGAPANAHFGQ